jgi:hypothetical protein
MTLTEMIYQHNLKLPEPAAREALDFIEFLEPTARAIAAFPHALAGVLG